MKLALLATLLGFGGSLAGFGLVSGTAGSAAPVAADVRSAAATEDVVVRGKHHDCPRAEKVKKT